MNIRDRVHRAPQGSLCLNPLAILRLDNSASKYIDTYSRPAINNGVDHRFVLECQQPDCSNGRGHAGHPDDSDGFRKRVVEGVYFHHLRADAVPFPTKDGKPRTVEVSVKIEKRRLSVC